MFKILRLKFCFFICFTAVLSQAYAFAPFPENLKFWEKKPVVVVVQKPIQTASLIENIGVPVGGKAGQRIRDRVYDEVKALKRIPGYRVSTLREGEVIKISIKTSMLFEPNETKLWNRAEKMLTPLLPYMVQDSLRTVLLAVYTDDTGTSDYLYNLSKKRVMTVAKWFETNGVSESKMVKYAKGAESPRVPNISDKNRDTNRRIEIYFVPTKKMVDLARKTKIRFKK